jgi:hypothetical protein
LYVFSSNAYVGTIDEVIIVGVDSGVNRTWELTYSYDPTEGFGGRGDIYLDFLEQTVIPIISVTKFLYFCENLLGQLQSKFGGK